MCKLFLWATCGLTCRVSCTLRVKPKGFIGAGLRSNTLGFLAGQCHPSPTNKQTKEKTYIHYTCNISRGIRIKKKLNKLLKVTFTLSYGHTMLKAPDPVRSPQLSNIWTSQYYGGGPHGNTGCCSSFIFF